MNDGILTGSGALRESTELRITHLEAGSMRQRRAAPVGTDLEGSLVRKPAATHICLIVPGRHACISRVVYQINKRGVM